MPRPNETVIRIANGAGFWGDNLDAPIRLVESESCDVLTLEYLAELTMAILAHLRSKDPQSAGYVSDFPNLLGRLAPHLLAQPNLTIVTNAGGLNPHACARRCATVLQAADLDPPIAVISGDDVLNAIPGWISDGYSFPHFETSESILGVSDRLVAANVYLGARPIADAIARGARIVITGRVADASLTVGPAAAAFGWKWDEYDTLAAASAAGHVIECGAQASGGLWHDWLSLPGLDAIGYPVAEIAADGSSVITKPAGSGGLVSVGTVAEQVVYEIDDPARYRTPDVDVDFTSLRLEEIAPDRVRMSGTKGAAPSPLLKVSGIYRDGYMAAGMLAVVGANAEAKARRAGRVLLDRVAAAGFALEHTLIECLGAGDVASGMLRPRSPAVEVVLRVTARDSRKAAIERFAKEFAPLITSGPPGMAGYAGGRAEVRPAFGYFPTLVPRALITPTIDIRPALDWLEPRPAHAPGDRLPASSPVERTPQRER
jgi:hypothetical protein